MRAIKPIVKFYISRSLYYKNPLKSNQKQYNFIKPGIFLKIIFIYKFLLVMEYILIKDIYSRYNIN